MPDKCSYCNSTNIIISKKDDVVSVQCKDCNHLQIIK